MSEQGAGLTILAALNPSRVIGKDGRLPWHHPADLARFARRTRGRPLIMGRRTWESLPKRPLPGRRNLVLSRAALPPEAERFTSLVDAIEAADPSSGEVFIIGGAALFAAAIDRVDTVELTWVPGPVSGPGLVYFPELADHFITGPRLPFPDAMELELQIFKRA